MIPSAMNKYIKAKYILSNSFDYIAPTYIPVRTHFGYLPTQGRLHPWDTEEARIARQVHCNYSQHYDQCHINNN